MSDQYTPLTPPLTPSNRLSDEAGALLSDQYVHIRNSVRESLKGHPSESVVVPITVRQLEALVR